MPGIAIVNVLSTLALYLLNKVTINGEIESEIIIANNALIFFMLFTLKNKYKHETNKTSLMVISGSISANGEPLIK